MKTFSEYINEKQNFIFGGKAGFTGKEYGTAIKTFAELVPGDYFYTWFFDEENGYELLLNRTVEVSKPAEELRRTNKYTPGYVVYGFDINDHEEIDIRIDDEVVNTPMNVFHPDRVFFHTNTLGVFTTYKAEPEEIAQTAKEQYDNREDF